MPINVYTGLMRSGKSYEVVSEVIVPAVRSGRRVVTNVDGISQEKIHQYLKSLYPNDDADAYGLIVHVNNAQVFEPKFFPYYDDDKAAHTDTTVQPGDLVCIDEAWRFWGATECKIHKNHKSFFLEHGHFTHEKTKVACDLVLMIQDMSTLNRFVKNVVAFNFRTHKKVALGMGNTYSVNAYEGSKQSKATQIGNWIRQYNKSIFPLYSSFKGGEAGVMVNADKRQNVFSNKKLWFMLALMIAGGSVSFYNAWRFFHPADMRRDGETVKSTATPSLTAPAAASPGIAAMPSVTSFSDAWRISGSYVSNGRSWVVLTNSAGAVRIDSPSMFQNTGYAQSGDIDGHKVTVWSGAPSQKAVSGIAPAPAVEVKK